MPREPPGWSRRKITNPDRQRLPATQASSAKASCVPFRLDSFHCVPSSHGTGGVVRCMERIRKQPCRLSRSAAKIAPSPLRTCAPGPKLPVSSMFHADSRCASANVHLADEFRDRPMVADEVLRAAAEVGELRGRDVDAQTLIERGEDFAEMDRPGARLLAPARR